MGLELKKKELIIERYREYLGSKGYRDKTLVNYTGNAGLLMEYLETLGIEDLREVTKSHLRSYQNYLYSNTSLKLNAQKTRLAANKNFFKYLDITGEIMYNPGASIELPRSPKLLPRKTLTEKEINKLLNAPDISTDLGLRDRAMMEVFYSTGIRNTELRNLELYDVDFEKEIITIREGKGGKDRKVPIGRIALVYVKEYLEGARPNLLTSNTKVLFLSSIGTKLSRDSIPFIVQRNAKLAGLDETIGAHTIRHSVATHLLRRGASIRYIQEFLGHSSLDTTQRYTRVEITDLKRVHRKTHPRENF